MTSGGAGNLKRHHKERRSRTGEKNPLSVVCGHILSLIPTRIGPEKHFLVSPVSFVLFTCGRRPTGHRVIPVVVVVVVVVVGVGAETTFKPMYDVSL